MIKELKRKYNRKYLTKHTSMIGIVFIAVFSLSYHFMPTDFWNLNSLLSELYPGNAISGQTGVHQEMLVHFIDVGQADCILAQNAGKNMLIDAGNNDDTELVIDYLAEQGVTDFDYIIGTHPHEDHIGSLDDVINHFDCKEVMLPNVVHTTRTFEDVLQVVQEKNLKITLPKIGSTYNLGVAKFTIIAPNRKYSEINDWSIGIKLVYGDNSFLLCGDAQADSEYDICTNGIDISADVLKVGHHGSSTATSELFLERVNPTYAIISCGKFNDYGHPHKETLDRLAKHGVKIYRTDEDGTIVARSDGKNISFVCKERK